MRRRRWLVPASAAALIGLIARPTAGQSLFQRPTGQQPPAAAEAGAPSAPAPGFAAAPNTPGADGHAGPGGPKHNPVADLAGVSLYAVQPVPARKFQVHDLITIIVNQSSKIERDQKLKTEKKFDDSVNLAAFPNLLDLFELRVPPPGRLATNNPQLSLNTNNKFDGKGDYSREDRFTARIQATVIDVKPNGTLVVEAKATTISDNEEQIMILTGSCRTEDVTAQNSVQSTQLADLRLETRNKGDIKDGSNKGILTRVFDVLFNF